MGEVQTFSWCLTAAEKTHEHVFCLSFEFVWGWPGEGGVRDGLLMFWVLLFFHADPELVCPLLCAGRFLYGDDIIPSESSLSSLGKQAPCARFLQRSSIQLERYSEDVARHLRKGQYPAC